MIPRVAIIGAGYSGALTAVHLVRSARAPLEVALHEASGVFARGAAYSTRSGEHLLNVPAGNMSALPDDPSDFVRWLEAIGLPASPDLFISRRVYGQYLTHLLASHTGRQEGGVRLTLHAAAIDDLEASSWQFRLRDSDGILSEADAVVLAPGNFPPAALPALERSLGSSPAYVRDPWNPSALEGLAPDASVLFVGTGQTAVDLALELEARGHQGKLVALSRHGLLHRPHRPPSERRGYLPPFTLDELPSDCLGLLRVVRERVRQVARTGHAWQDVIAALRPITPDLWRRLPRSERERFLRHLRPFWEVHRHRLAPSVAARLGSLAVSGQFQVLAGRLLAADPVPNGVRVLVARRTSGERHALTVARIINCTGPARTPAGSPLPLLSNLERRGMIALDPLGLGLSTTEDGEVLDAERRPVPGLHLAGPLRLGDLYECVAVPELRVHTQALARHLLATLHRPQLVV